MSVSEPEDHSMKFERFPIFGRCSNCIELFSKIGNFFLENWHGTLLEK